MWLCDVTVTAQVVHKSRKALKIHNDYYKPYFHAPDDDHQL